MLTSDETKEGRNVRCGRVRPGRGVSISGRERKLVIEARVARNVVFAKGLRVVAWLRRRRARERECAARHLFGGQHAPASRPRNIVSVFAISPGPAGRSSPPCLRFEMLS
jgi:hypothetical protein